MKSFDKFYTLKGLSHSCFCENFNYDSETGLITWKKARRKITVGSLAFNTPQSAGYLEGGFMLKRFLAHRVAFFIYHGFITDEVDHINLNRTDNRIENLRLADRQVNSYNLPKRSDNTSGFKGVCFDKRKGLWMARIHKDKKPSFIGYYRSKYEAAQAYSECAEKMHGEYRRLE